jgi:hypothetical protein
MAFNWLRIRQVRRINILSISSEFIHTWLPATIVIIRVSAEIASYFDLWDLTYAYSKPYGILFYDNHERMGGFLTCLTIE